MADQVACPYCAASIKIRGVPFSSCRLCAATGKVPQAVAVEYALIAGVTPDVSNILDLDELARAQGFNLFEQLCASIRQRHQ